MALPVLTAEIDFQGNPTATYGDIHSTSSDVLSFWRMNSASTFLDTKSLNNGSIVSTPSLTAGPYTYDADQGLAFDGSADGATVLPSGAISTGGPFTIEGWVKLPSLPGATRDLVSRRGAFVLSVDSSGKLIWQVKNNTTQATVTSNTTLVTNTYYLVTCVYDGANALLYINGVLDSYAAHTVGWEASYQPMRWAITPYTTSPGLPTAAQDAGAGTSRTVTKPAGTADGDFLLAHINWNSTVAVSSVPALWHPASLVQSGAHSQATYWKVAASEGANYTWQWGSSVNAIAFIARLTGVDNAYPWSSGGNAANTGSGTSLSCVSKIPNAYNTLVLALYSSLSNSSFTPGGSFTDFEDATTGTISANGSLLGVGAPTSTTPTSTSTAGGAWISTVLVMSGSGNNFVAATLDDWAFWNKALSSSEVQASYYAKDSGEGTYTNIKSNVRHFSTTGPKRQYELNRMEASNSDVLLRDFGHDFDPGDSTSIYFPNVIPVRRIRLKATWNSTTYPVLKEFIERWPPQGGEAVDYQEIAVTSVDGFDLMSQARVTGVIPIGYSGSQINALLDKAFWPVADRAIDTGQYVMAAADLGTSTDALSMIQEIADSERGVFFIDNAGIATFHDAAHRGSQSRSTTSQATFADDVSGSAIIYQDLTPSADKDRIINDWTVSPDSTVFGAAAQRVTDWQSVAKYGLRSETRTTRLASNASALDQAGNLLNETAGFAIRFDSMLVIPTTTAGYDKCLDLRIGDRVTVKRGTGTGWTGALIQKDCFVEGKAVEASPGEPWRFTFSLSPVSLGNYFATIFRDGPISYWRMDTIT